MESQSQERRLWVRSDPGQERRIVSSIWPGACNAKGRARGPTLRLPAEQDLQVPVRDLVLHRGRDPREEGTPGGDAVELRGRVPGRAVRTVHLGEEQHV